MQQAADVLGVSASTVRRWADSDRLTSRRAPSGQRRFLAAEALPLLAHDEVIGLVNVLDHVERSYSAQEIAVAEAVGRLVALALEHAQLYDKVKRLHVGNLRALSSALSRAGGHRRLWGDDRGRSHPF